MAKQETLVINMKQQYSATEPLFKKKCAYNKLPEDRQPA